MKESKNNPTKKYWHLLIFCIASNRIARLRFIGLLYICIILFYAGINLLMKGLFLHSANHLVLIVAGAVLLVFSTINIFSLSIKRLHDIGLNGFFAAGTLLPLPSGLRYLEFVLLAFYPGKKEENRFGKPPAAPNIGDWILFVCTLITAVALIILLIRFVYSFLHMYDQH